MGDLIRFPGVPDEREAARIQALHAARSLDGAAASLGTPEEWAWSAVAYLKPFTNAGSSGSAEVSTAALGVLLVYLEDLAGRLAIIPPSETDA